MPVGRALRPVFSIVTDRSAHSTDKTISAARLTLLQPLANQPAKLSDVRMLVRAHAQPGNARSRENVIDKLVSGLVVNGQFRCAVVGIRRRRGIFALDDQLRLKRPRVAEDEIDVPGIDPVSVGFVVAIRVLRGNECPQPDFG